MHRPAGTCCTNNQKVRVTVHDCLALPSTENNAHHRQNRTSKPFVHRVNRHPAGTREPASRSTSRRPVDLWTRSSPSGRGTNQRPRSEFDHNVDNSLANPPGAGVIRQCGQFQTGKINGPFPCQGRHVAAPVRSAVRPLCFDLWNDRTGHCYLRGRDLGPCRFLRALNAACLAGH